MASGSAQSTIGRMAALFLLLAPALSIASGTLNEDLTALHEARDLPGIEQRLAEAGEDELDSVAGLRWQAWLARDRDAEAALAFLDRGLQLEPNNVELILMRTGITLSGLSASGGLSALRAARAASQELERAVELAPDHAGVRLSLAQYLNNAPRIAGGSSRQAQVHIEALKSINRASYLGMKAQSAMGNNDLDAALAYLEQAIELDGRDEWRFLYGLAMQQVERWDQARAIFNAMVDTNPRHGAAWYQLGRTAVLSEAEVASGMAAFEHFLELPLWPGDPPHAAAWWRVGQLHELGNEIEQARQAYDRALTEDPDFEEARAALKSLKAQ